jgi:hypothetical protein
VLGRYCWDVHRKLQELDLELPYRATSRAAQTPQGCTLVRPQKETAAGRLAGCHHHPRARCARTLRALPS